MAHATLTKDHAEIQALAAIYDLVPVELLPHIVDHVPSTIRLLTAAAAMQHDDYRLILWEDFFVKFDLLGLVCAYQKDTGRTELYQRYAAPAGHVTPAH